MWSGGDEMRHCGRVVKWCGGLLVWCDSDVDVLGGNVSEEIG